MTPMRQQYDNAARAIAQEGRLSPDVSAAALFAYVDSVPGHRTALMTVLAAQQRAANGGGRPIDPTPETRRIECETLMLGALTVLERHMTDHEHWERLTPQADSITDLGRMIATAKEAFADNLAELPALLAAHRALRSWHPSDGPQGDAA